MLRPRVLLETPASRLWAVENYTPDLYETVKELPLEKEPPITIMGRELRQRRDVGFFSDESLGYRYSGSLMSSAPLTPFLRDLLAAVNESLGTNFNGVLVNAYRTGENYLSAHSDNERALDKNKRMVAGLAYGATRTFRVRDKNKKIVLDFPHKPATLIVMEGGFQGEFTHEIPPQKKVKDERISLTFRHHLE